MQKFFLILFVGILGISVCRQIQNTPNVNDVLLENVEALAQSEISEPMSCQGDGDVICPINNKNCAYVFLGYSLR